MRNTRLLLVVNKSNASDRAVRYVSQVIGQRRGYRICLGYLLPALPPILLEFGGSEDPEKEKRLDAKLKADQRRWISAAKKAAQTTLDRAILLLRKAKVPSRAIQNAFSDPADGENVTREILKLAKTHKCHSIVIGRQTVSWLRRVLRRDLAEELISRGKGFTIWVVE